MSINGTTDIVVKSVLFGRDSGRDPARYQENSIYISNNDNSNDNARDPADLGKSDVGKNAVNFETNLFLLIT